mgnify:CR=1 FL=1|jgi:hypothetical protein
MSDAENLSRQSEQELKTFLANASSIDGDDYSSVPESFYEGSVIKPQSFFESSNLPPFPGDFRVLKGTVTVASTAGNATAAELQTGIQDAYASASFNAVPMFGDIITLTNASGGALVGRFIVILEDDDAPGEATITFTSDGKTRFALNLTSTTAAGLTDAFDQYVGIFDESAKTPNDADIDTEEEGKGSSPFQISISNVYNTVSAGGTLVIGAAPTVTVATGTLTPMQGLDATIGSPGSQQITAPADGDPKYLHIYAQYTINFTGGVGGRVANSVTGAAFVFEDSETNNFLEGGTFSSGGASYTHRTHIGSVVVVKRGSRRFARINQKRSGNIVGIQNFNSTSTGTSTDSSGTDVSAKTKSGLREVILCLDGEPYSTFILTGPLFEIT